MRFEAVVHTAEGVNLYMVKDDKPMAAILGCTAACWQALPAGVERQALSSGGTRHFYTRDAQYVDLAAAYRA
jgi:hypothetical protein